MAPLQGIVVLELCEVFQGPLAGQILGDFGADVLKIERPPGGDSLRRSDTVAIAQGRIGSFFAATNRNKQSLCFDLKAPEGREALLSLVQKADVLLHNYRPGVMDRLGFGYDALSALNPRLVYASASGFGETGPYANMAGQDLLIQAVSGLAMKTTCDSGEPTFLNVPLTDFSSGTLLAQGVLLALLERARSGRGQKVTVSLLNAAMAMQSLEAATLLNFDYETRWFDRALNFTAQASDGWLTVLGFFRDNPLRLICNALGLPDLSLERGWDHGLAQARSKADIVPRLRPAFAGLTVADAVQRLQSAGVLAAPIHTLQSALAMPQTKANDLVREVPVDGQPSMRLIGSPVDLSRTPATIRSGPPHLGAHTLEQAPRRVPAVASQISQWTVPALLAQCAAKHPDRVFVEMLGGDSETYGGMFRSARRFANGLAHLGVTQGETVVVMVPNSLAAMHAWLGINMLGATEASINTGYRGQSLEHAVNQCESACMVVAAEHVDTLVASLDRLPHLKKVVVAGGVPFAGVCAVRPDIQWSSAADFDETVLDAQLPEVSHSDTASIIFTSGTTGPAKGVQMPHAQVCLLAQLACAKTGLHADDVFYSYYPLYHMAGKFMSVLAVMVAGAKIVLDSGFKAEEWLQRIRTSGATMTAAHGPMLEMVFALPPSPQDREHKLRLVRTAPFPKRIAATFEQRFGVKGLEVWGMTEIGVPCWSDEREPLRAGSCGRVEADWYELQIVDPDSDTPLPAGQIGEIVVRPRYPWTTMQGYIGMPKQTASVWRNLWFHTGDLATIDSDGYVHFVDRAGDRIRRRAENIAAFDIESAAMEHPLVLVAVAVGVPSGYESDEDIKLSIVLREDAVVTPVTLLEHLARRLPHYMMPRYIEIVEHLPRSVTGKIQRQELKAPSRVAASFDRRAAGIEMRTFMQTANLMVNASGEDTLST